MRPSDVTSALAAETHLVAGAVDAVADARALLALAAEQRDVRHVDRHLLVDDAALHRGARGFLMFLHPVHALRRVDDHAPRLRDHARDRARLADVLAGEHDDFVTLTNFHVLSFAPLRQALRATAWAGAHAQRCAVAAWSACETCMPITYSTSGASDTMRMNLRSRSSRPTGPKMRVPRGCIWSLISTAAFSSKRM